MFLNHSDEFGVKVLSHRAFFLRTLRTNRTVFWMRYAHPTQPQYKYLFHSVHFAISFLFPTKIMKKKGREVSFITKKTPPVPLFLYILHNFYGELPPFHPLKMKQKPFLSLFIYTHVINKTLLV